MSCKICLFNPDNNKVIKEIIINDTYVNCEKKVEQLNKKKNKKGYYYKLTDINI